MKKKSEIIIVGAGMAGLAAANRLREKDYNVTLLEARPHAGGRTHSVPLFNAMFDEGAFMIHGTVNNPIADLSDQIKVPYCSLNFSRQYLTDSQLREINFQKFEEEFDHLLVQAKQWATLQPTDCSLAEAMQQALQLNPSSDEFKAYFEWKMKARGPYYGAEFTSISARHWDVEEELSGAQAVMLQGYQPLVDHLAKDFNILLNEWVTGIAYSQSSVQVKTQSRQFKADAVIVTVPLGILQKEKIKFYPELPVAKKQALAHLKMGVLDKIVLQFPEIFWPHDAQMIGNLTWLDSFSLLFNYYPAFKQNILIAFVGGDQARQMELRPEQIVIDEVMQKIRDLFGEKAPNPIQTKIFRWASDPYTYGSYSYTPIGAMPEDYTNLAKSIDDKIFFAGEATNHQYPATTHGAYLSGIRAAQEIIDIA